MKKIILIFILISPCAFAFAQKTPTTKSGSSGTINIDVPNFANPATKQFYDAYTSHIKKAVLAVRNKDEAGFMKLAAEGKTLEKKFQYYITEKNLPRKMLRKNGIGINRPCHTYRKSFNLIIIKN